jgi:hypothetical protein
MATYTQIQLYVAEKFGWIPETCWIADAKRKCGLPMKDAPNRKNGISVKPCPDDKLPAIEEAFRHFGMI